MSEKEHELWRGTLHSSLAEFISRPGAATEAQLKLMIERYRQEADAGRIPPYRYVAR